jgi:hypothetical protein
MIAPADVLAVERAYAAAGASSATRVTPAVDVATAAADAPAMSAATTGTAEQRRRARACAGAVASRYLAVGTPRSFAVIIDAASHDDAIAVLEAHRTWFAPRDVRIAISAHGVAAPSVDLAAVLGARVVTIDEALACDIVCICVPLALCARQLRRGTHVNALAAVELDSDLSRTATIVDEPTLAAMAAGMRDGRQLDEITIFLAMVNRAEPLHRP